MSIWALARVMDCSEATLGARLVLFVLAEHAHDDGSETYPAVETLMRRTRLSRRGVQGALRRLEQDGEIVADGLGPNGTSKWRLTFRGGAESAPGGGADNDVGGRTFRRRGGADSAPEPSLGTVHEPSKGRAADQTSLDVAEDRVGKLVAWHSEKVVQRVGRAPAVTAQTRPAARELLRLADGSAADLTGMFEFALSRTFWASKVLTLPKFRQHYLPLRAEWLAARETNGRRPDAHQPPDGPAATRVSYDEDRIREER